MKRVGHACMVAPGSGCAQPQLMRLPGTLSSPQATRDLVYLDGRAHTGVVLARMRRLTDEERAAQVVHLFQENGEQRSGAFTVLSNSGV